MLSDPRAGVSDTVVSPIACIPESRRQLETPEKALWRAVLEEALRAASGFSIVVPNSGTNESELRQNARRWLWAPEIGHGTFEWVASHLGLDCGALRAALDDGRASFASRRVASGFVRTMVGRRSNAYE